MLRQIVVLLALMSLALPATGLDAATLEATEVDATALASLEPKPDKFKDVEGCYLWVLDKVIPPGESATNHAACELYTCLSMFVAIFTCDSNYCVPPNAVVEVYSRIGPRPFPACCPLCQ